MKEESSKERADEEKVVEPLLESDACECECCENAMEEECLEVEPETLDLLEEEKAKNASLMQQLQLLQADFDNYRKRNMKLADEARQKGIFEAIKAILPAFDAVIIAKKQITDESTLEGLLMVEKELFKTLEELEITPIKSIGEQFDPNLHNAVFAEEVEGKEAGEILEEFSMGFNSPYGVVRFATVKIAK